jgi:hypothetical protein
MASEADLLEVVGALRHRPHRSHFLDADGKQAEHDRDDADEDKRLDQGDIIGEVKSAGDTPPRQMANRADRWQKLLK